MESLWSGNLYLFKFCISSQICFCFFLKEKFSSYHKELFHYSYAWELVPWVWWVQERIVTGKEGAHGILILIRTERWVKEFDYQYEMVQLQASKQAQGSKEEHPAKTLGHPQTGLSGASWPMLF